MTDVSFRFELLQAPTTVVHPTPRPLVQTPEAKPRITGVHPAVIKIAMSAVVWFLAVAWLDFMGGPEVDTALAVSTGFFVMFFTRVPVVIKRMEFVAVNLFTSVLLDGHLLGFSWGRLLAGFIAFGQFGRALAGGFNLPNDPI